MSASPMKKLTTPAKHFVTVLEDMVEEHREEMQSGFYEKLLTEIGNQKLLMKRFRYGVLTFDCDSRTPKKAEQLYFERHREKEEPLLEHKQQKAFEKSYFTHFQVAPSSFKWITVSIINMASDYEWFLEHMGEELLTGGYVKELKPSELFVPEQGFHEFKQSIFQIVALQPKILRVFIDRLKEKGEGLFNQQWTPSTIDLAKDDEKAPNMLVFGLNHESLEFGSFSLKSLGVPSVKTRTGMCSCAYVPEIAIGFKEVE